MISTGDEDDFRSPICDQKIAGNHTEIEIERLLNGAEFASRDARGLLANLPRVFKGISVLYMENLYSARNFENPAFSQLQRH